MSARLTVSLTLALMLGVACADAADPDASAARGPGLKAARLPVAAEAAVYAAAVRATFDASPGLVLRLHPQHLPRTAGMAGGDSVPVALLTALRERGVVVGSCAPERDAPRNTPRCQGTDVGYLIRATDVLQAAGDTVQLHLSAESYGAATGQRPQALRLETIYQLVGAGDDWRVVREARARVVE